MEKIAHIITKENLEKFKVWLIAEERESRTVRKYLHDLAALGQ